MSKLLKEILTKYEYFTLQWQVSLAVLVKHRPDDGTGILKQQSIYLPSTRVFIKPTKKYSSQLFLPAIIYHMLMSQVPEGCVSASTAIQSALSPQEVAEGTARTEEMNKNALW